MADYYRLNADKTVTEIADSTEWALAFENRDACRVGIDELPDGTLISTVFLGLNHAFNDEDAPEIFETMVFPSRDNLEEQLCWRYSTWDQAEAGHAKAVALAKDYAARGEPLSDLWNEDQPA